MLGASRLALLIHIQLNRAILPDISGVSVAWLSRLIHKFVIPPADTCPIFFFLRCWQWILWHECNCKIFLLIQIHFLLYNIFIFRLLENAQAPDCFTCGKKTCKCGENSQECMDKQFMYLFARAQANINRLGLLIGQAFVKPHYNDPGTCSWDMPKLVRHCKL